MKDKSHSGINHNPRKELLNGSLPIIYFIISEFLCSIGFWLNNFAFDDGYGTWYGYYFYYDTGDKIFFFIFSLFVGSLAWFSPNALMLLILQLNKIHSVNIRELLFLSLLMFLFCFLTVCITLFWLNLVFDLNIMNNEKYYTNITFKYCIIGTISSMFALLIFLNKKD